MARKKQVQTRIPEDMKQELEQYRETRNISQADAVRRLVRIGLDREQQAAPDGGEVMDRLDKFEQRQNEISEARDLAQKRQTLAILTALVYIAITVGTDISGIGWGLAGIVSIAIVWATTWNAWGDNE